MKTKFPKLHSAGTRGAAIIGRRQLEEETPAKEQADHPLHYGGADNPYEAIKVIEAWGLGFRLGNAVKYIARAGKKGSFVEDLRKARWYLDREISRLEATNGRP